MKYKIQHYIIILLITNLTFSQSVILESFGPSFNTPVEIKNAGDDRLFVVEKSGKIKILNQNGSVNSTPFLDIEDKVSTNANERGLLGLAFHPNYPENPFFFVNYTNNNGDTTISKFSVSSDEDIANDNETILLVIDQPYGNHNGGCINFGPDGNLYIGMGDGGSGGDPQNYSQNTGSLLGKMLRINVNSGAYSIPENNPYNDEIKAICETANDYDMIVAAHAHGDEGIQRAVIGGVHTIEHGTLLSEESMKLMKQYGTYYVPTITAGKEVAANAKIPGYYDELVVPKALAIGPKIQSTTERAYKAGVNIAFGSDAGVFPHGKNAKEFVYMNEAGIPIIECLQAATIVNAKILSMETEIGQIEKGFIADIVATKLNPEDDISTLENIVFVMKEGVIYKN